MTKLEGLLKKLKEHQPIVVNYGKGDYSNKDIKELALWNEEANRYCSITGVWSTELLIEIAKGLVPNTSLELYDEENKDVK